MKKLLSLFVVVLCMTFSFCGCNNDQGDNSNDNGDSQIVTSTTQPTKKSLSAEDFQKKIEGISSMNFTTKLITDADTLKIFPYEGLKAAVKANVDGSDIAIFYVFDTDENAKKVIEDARAMNYSEYDEEKGSNYDKLWHDASVVEQVDNTLITVSSDDQNVTDLILNAIKY